jgi:hypothetical protein
MRKNQSVISLVFVLVILLGILSSCSSNKGARKCNGTKMIKTKMN